MLVAMFGGIYWFLSPAPGSAPPPRLPDCEQHFSWVSVAPTLLLFVTVSLLFAFLRRIGGAAEFRTTFEPASLALADRRWEEARALYHQAAERFAKKPFLRSAALMNAATVEMWAGKLTAARASYEAAERGLAIANYFAQSGIRVLIASGLAEVYALAGDLDAADRWLAEANARLERCAEERVGHRSQVCVGEAIVRCRRGDFRGAITLLDEHLLKLRHGLNVNWMRAVDVVRAFAEAQSSHEGVRGQHRAAELLVRIGPVTPNEFAFLGAEWPEMRAFLAANGLCEG